MDRDESDLLKRRELNFCTLRPDKQVEAARAMLEPLDGIHSLEPLSDYALQVEYDITQITLEAIETLLTDLGFHLSSKLLFKLRRALYYYTEETLRINLGLEGGIKDCKQLFINRYEHLNHECRDQLPEHWRNYR